MIKQQELCEAFLTRVEPEHRAPSRQKLHELFVNNGCTVEIKPTSGAVSRLPTNLHPLKKRLQILCFAKAALLLRLYATPTPAETKRSSERALPEDLLAAIRKAPDCKRLTRAGACGTPRCAAGS